MGPLTHKINKMIPWQVFCATSSIHGLRQVANAKKTYLERFIWLVIVLLLGAFQVINNVLQWESFNNQEPDFAITDISFPVASVDFPAVTICTFNKLNLPRAEAYVQSLTNKTSVEAKQVWDTLSAFQLMETYNLGGPWEFKLKHNPTFVELPDGIESTMRKVAPRLEDIFVGCKWKNEKHKCSDLFREQRTMNGFCYSFNSKTAERTENKLERGSKSSLTPYKDGDTKSFRAKTYGVNSGLRVNVKEPTENAAGKFGSTEENEDWVHGYQVFIHRPNKFPDLFNLMVTLNEGGESARILVDFKTIKSSEGVQSIEQKERKCILSSGSSGISESIQKEGEGCRHYNQMTIIRDNCNCLPYYYPKIFSGIRDCGVDDFECLAGIEGSYKMSWREEMWHNEFIPDEVIESDSICLPMCEETNYYPTIQTFPSHWNNSNNWATLEIGFIKEHGIQYARQWHRKTFDFIEYFTGYAGLTLGMSLISVAELIVFIFHTLLICLKKYSSNIKIGRTSKVKRRRGAKHPKAIFPYLP